MRPEEKEAEGAPVFPIRPQKLSFAFFSLAFS